MATDGLIIYTSCNRLKFNTAYSVNSFWSVDGNTLEGGDNIIKVFNTLTGTSLQCLGVSNPTGTTSGAMNIIGGLGVGGSMNVNGINTSTLNNSGNASVGGNLVVSGTITGITSSINPIVSNYAVNTWNLGIASSSNSWNKMVWSYKLAMFLCLTNNVVGTNNSMYSYDGINWITQSIPNYAWYGLCWYDKQGIFCAVGGLPLGAALSMTSPDGVVWTSGVIKGGSYNVSHVVYSPLLDIFCVVLHAGYSAVSNDGINWTTSSTPYNSVIAPTL